MFSLAFLLSFWSNNYFHNIVLILSADIFCLFQALQAQYWHFCLFWYYFTLLLPLNFDYCPKDMTQISYILYFLALLMTWLVSWTIWAYYPWAFSLSFGCNLRSSKSQVHFVGELMVALIEDRNRHFYSDLTWIT